MTLDRFFDVVAKIAIQCDRGAALLEDLERFTEQAWPGRIGWQEPRHDALVRLDEYLVAIGREGQHSIKVACCLRARDVNDRHGTIVARIQELW